MTASLSLSWLWRSWSRVRCFFSDPSPSLSFAAMTGLPGGCPIGMYSSVTSGPPAGSGTKQERIADIVAELQGTPLSLPNVLRGEEETDQEILDAIDSELFECRGCGWWCEHSEAQDEEEDHPDGPICDDCEP